MLRLFFILVTLSLGLVLWHGSQLPEHPTPEESVQINWSEAQSRNFERYTQQFCEFLSDSQNKEFSKSEGFRLHRKKFFSGISFSYFEEDLQDTGQAFP